MTSVKLVWATPYGDELIAYMARVSSSDQRKDPQKLIRYLLKKHHWSPFEMVNMCFEVVTTRDIGRQYLRHWSMRVQEFSQRYADVSVLGEPIFRDARMQHPTDRQKSIDDAPDDVQAGWLSAQQHVWDTAIEHYQRALDRGIAKEVARVLLPEGMTPTKMYFNANLRTVMHMLDARSEDHGAQPEAIEVAKRIEDLFAEHFPVTYSAWIIGP